MRVAAARPGGLGGAVCAGVVPVGPGGGRDVYTVIEPRFWPRPALQIVGTLWERLSGSSPRSSWAEVVSLGRQGVTGDANTPRSLPAPCSLPWPPPAGPGGRFLLCIRAGTRGCPRRHVDCAVGIALYEQRPPSGRVFGLLQADIDIYCSRGRDSRGAGLRPQNRRASRVWRGSRRQAPAVHCLLVLMRPVICLRTAVPRLS